MNVNNHQQRTQDDSLLLHSNSPESLDLVVRRICESMKTEKIYLLNTYPAFPKSFGTEYDLLVLISSKYKKPLHEFESLIDNRCHSLAIVTTSVYKLDTMKELLDQGNIYFSTLCNMNRIIFDGDSLMLGKDPSENIDFHLDDLKTIFEKHISKAKSFLSGATGYRIAGDNQLAAFMLHQTVEQGLNSFLTPFIGNRIQTHNLTKLLIHARRLSGKLYEVFPRNTDSEIQLYRTLYKSYIYGRYKNDFQIDVENLDILFKRVSQLIELIPVVFYEKVDEFRSKRSLFFKQL